MNKQQRREAFLRAIKQGRSFGNSGAIQGVRSFGAAARDYGNAPTGDAAQRFKTLREKTAQHINQKVFYDGSGDVRAVHRGKDTLLGTIRLKSDAFPLLTDSNASFVSTKPLMPAGVALTASTAIAMESRVAMAGARVIVWDDMPANPPAGPTGVVMTESRPAWFSTVMPAKFSVVAPDLATLTADQIAAGAVDSTKIGNPSPGVSTSDLPVSRARIDMRQATQHAVSFTIPRRQQKDITTIDAEVIAAILTGIAREIDATLLAAIVAAAPQPFTLGAAAAQCLKFEDLSALVGTAGTGAVISQDGVLRANGIDAELVPDISQTVIGAFDRSAVVVHEDIDLTVSRLNVQGSVTVTAWLNLLPCVPDASKFFLGQ